MTKEESIVMWNMEKSNVNAAHFTKGMKKLYNEVDTLINNGIITYEDFSGDMLDMVTTMIVDTTNKDTQLDRAEQIDYICEQLLNKYAEKHTKVEPVEGDTGISENNELVQNESGVCELEGTTEAC